MAKRLTRPRRLAPSGPPLTLPDSYAETGEPTGFEWDQTATADGAGRAQVEFPPVPNAWLWEIRRCRIWMVSTVLEPEGRLYVLGGRYVSEAHPTLLFGTVTGTRDMAEGDPHVILPAQWLRFVWTAASPGGIGTCVIEGIESPAPGL